MRRSTVVAVIVTAACALVPTACGDDADDDAATTTTTAPAGTAPGSTAPAGTAPASTAPASTGPASTGSSGSGSDATGGTPTTASAPSGPVFASFSVQADACPAGAPAAPDVSVTTPPYDGKVYVSWKVTGPYDEIYTAVDDPDGPYASGLPSSGRQEFTRQCTSPHTYYVVAVSNGKKTVRSDAVPAG